MGLNLAKMMAEWDQQQSPVERVGEQIEYAMLEAGIEDLPDNIILDGTIHRFGKNKTGWYKGYADGCPVVVFGDWSLDINSKWVGSSSNPLSEDRISELLAVRSSERNLQYKSAANASLSIWESCEPAQANHPYLLKKRIKPCGAKVTGDGRLVVPLYLNDNIVSLQYISQSGNKKYQAGSTTKGAYHVIGDASTATTLYLAEGFATAVTIHEAIEAPVVVAYSAQNLVSVVKTMQKLHPSKRIIVVADNDKSGVGAKSANSTGVDVIMPPMEGDANDYANAGHDLKALLTTLSIKPAWAISLDDFVEEPAPIEWLIRGWLQKEALHMVYGASGCGKTFVVLDWLLRLGSNLDSWNECKAIDAPILYMAGEGVRGLRGRVAAWKHYHHVKTLNGGIVPNAFDLNTPAGLAEAIEGINSLDFLPSVIVVDTLNRFFDGDENSAKDTKTMLISCTRLIAEFGCSVIIVHHTGVAKDVQDRARGSGAWRGALDVEIRVENKDDGITITHTKAKDFESPLAVAAKLTPVTIPGWYDEDGAEVGSAIVEITEAEVVSEADPAARGKKLIESAWWASGSNRKDGKPFIPRAGLMKYLIENQGKSETYAKKLLRPSVNPIKSLVDSGTIDHAKDGITIIDPALSSLLLMLS